ncbi:uncharacterized protein LOC126893850 isoform X2 [Daktulosphaira vitifoliae]|uniref:uncharacterized protein LOC126893850 isoform X2 n=1 Tax=Daktulosphaira vitifoliae TaxID=58002 RepID=UPI0021A9CF3A|nr:uncharacterized protein LOC126893850 isoform X2 [Daktulosphaira vitifoliae]
MAITSLLVSTLFAVACVECRNVPVPTAVPYNAQPYHSQAFTVQPKYNGLPYVVSPYFPGSYFRQDFLPANPAYNPYLYGAYPAFPQQYPFNDGTQVAENAGAESSYIDYLTYYYNNYFPSWSSIYGGSSETTSAESSQQTTASEGAAVNAENSIKGEKPTEGLKSETPNTVNQVPIQYPYRPFAAPQFSYFGQPQFYGQYQQPAYHGSISNYILGYPQQVIGQRFHQAPQYEAPGSAALAYQKYLQHHKQNSQQSQQGVSQVQQDASSVTVNSVTNQPENDDQQAQTKITSDPTRAVAEPIGVAFAGIGGQAGAGPVGTAIVGKNATAVADPKATAISIDETPSFNIIPVHKMTSAYIAKYTPESGVYKIVEIK